MRRDEFIIERILFIFVILISKSDGRPNFASELADVLDEKVNYEETLNRNINKYVSNIKEEVIVDEYVEEPLFVIDETETNAYEPHTNGEWKEYKTRDESPVYQNWLEEEIGQIDTDGRIPNPRDLSLIYNAKEIEINRDNDRLDQSNLGGVEGNVDGFMEQIRKQDKEKVIQKQENVEQHLDTEERTQSENTANITPEVNAPGGSNPIQQHQKLLAEHIRKAEDDNASSDTEKEIQKPTTTDVLETTPKHAIKTEPKKLKSGKMTDVVLKNIAKKSAKAPPVPWSKQKGKHAKVPGSSYGKIFK